jgi:sugar/nucleoside kinase (ribokinase family)
MPSASRNVLCLGEAFVEMICERPVESLAEADMFVPHFGGAIASVALMAARAGARMALAGGTGDDEWGRWLREALERSGVDLRHFKLIENMGTPLALTTLDHAGEPHRHMYGDAIATVVDALWGGVEEAVQDCGGLFISSGTLIGEAERQVTMRARERALELEHPVIFDPRLRPRRWSSKADAAASANACVPGALLVRASAADARLMTGEDDLDRAALALRKAGARNVVITDGSARAMLRGKIRLDIEGFQGASVIAAPDGSMLAVAEPGAGVQTLAADCRLGAARDKRRGPRNDALGDRRPEHYVNDLGRC